MYAPNPSHAESSESLNIRRVGFLLAFAAIPFFAVLTILMGKEAGWDFQNYHWYDPFAALNGRLGFDVSVGHHATYYNPLLDIPLYWIGVHFPAWVAGVWLGVVAGVGAALVGAIAYRLIPLADKRWRLVAASVLALAGMFGGGTLGEIGKTSDDIAGGLGILAAVFILVAGFSRVVRAGPGDLIAVLLPAGFLAGASPGVKLTMATYIVGLGLAMLVLPGSPMRRILRAGVLGIGVLLGIAAFGGFWFWTMWQYSGDPLFPYFSNVFHTSLVPPGDYRDASFVPTTWARRAIFPFLFSADSKLVAEWDFRDVHIAILYVVAPVAGLIAALGFRPHGRLVDPLAARMILVFAGGTYLAWLFLFAIYRYLVPLEMLAPIVIALAVAILPLSVRVRVSLAVLLLAVAQLAAWKGEEPRLAWGDKYVEVALPKLSDPAHTMVLMTGWEPMAYVIPEFPPEIPFLRIQGYMVGSNDKTYDLSVGMQKRVAEHQGPLYVMFLPKDQTSTISGLADYGLVIDDSACQTVVTNVGNPLNFCSLKKASP